MNSTENPRHLQIQAAEMRGASRQKLGQPEATAEVLYPADTELANAFRKGWHNPDNY